VTIVGMVLGTMLVMTGKVSAADLSLFRVPWPW
jgi:hypothetical protein